MPDMAEDEKFYPIGAVLVCVWLSSRMPASDGWYVVPVAGGVLKLENMDLMMDAAGDGCGVVVVRLWVRVRWVKPRLILAKTIHMPLVSIDCYLMSTLDPPPLEGGLQAVCGGCL